MPQSKTKTAKKVTKKTEITKKPKKTVGAKKPSVQKGIAAPMFDITGKSQGQINLPKEVFGQKPNKNLLAQAIRVYFNNLSTHTAATKTRAHVRGGGTKPWRQKGTGRARAGSIRSPLWVGGGITFGPHPRKVQLSLPQKMKRQALTSALSKQREDGTIKVISHLEEIEPKTKLAASLFRKLSISGKTLVVLEEQKANVKLAVRNIPDAQIELAQNLNAYKVISSRNLVFSKAAIEKFSAQK